MSGATDAKAAWIGRVLGITVRTGAAAGPDGSGDELRERLQLTGNVLRQLRDMDDPAAAGLMREYGQIAALAPTDAGAAGLRLEAVEASAYGALSGARARGAGPPKGRGVAFRKLLLRWRKAQEALAANMETLGATLLAVPEVRADPRFAEVQRAVAGLPGLVPRFGGALEDVLDAAMSEVEPGELGRLAARGVAAVDEYRRQLETVKGLAELEQFASEQLGKPLSLHGALDEALTELRSQLAA